MPNKTVSAKKNNFPLRTKKLYEVVMARSHDLPDGIRWRGDTCFVVTSKIVASFFGLNVRVTTNWILMQ